MSEQLLNIGLPKWPALLVNGTSVSPEQAKEIIRRTDRGFGDICCFYGTPELCKAFGFDQESRPELFDWNKIETWRESWGLLDTNYIHVDWLDSSYIGGPTGWCHPNGSMGCFKNIGKWPSLEDVLKDWEAIASAFPFLDLTATLGDREYCEEGLLSLVEFRISNGKVSLREPTVQLGNLSQFALDQTLSYFRDSLEGDFPTSPIPADWIEEWAEKSRSILTEINTSTK